MQDVGIDEAYLDITESPLPSDGIARRIKADIRKATSLTCSIGIAPNKLVAKIASDLDKPDGLTIVKTQDVEHVLGPLPVRKLHGVGPKTEARLLEMGVETVSRLRAVPRDRLVAIFGTSHGTYLFQASRGIDDRPLVTTWKRKSISRERTFEKDIQNWQDIARNLAALSKRVVQDMTSRGLKARTVGIKIRYSDFTTLTRVHTLPEALDSLETIRRAAFENLGRVDLKGKKVRLIGVRLEGLGK
jgi:DNA polymerase-4